MHCARHSIAAVWPLAMHRPPMSTPAHTNHLSWCLERCKSGLPHTQLTRESPEVAETAWQALITRARHYTEPTDVCGVLTAGMLWEGASSRSIGIVVP